MSDMDPRKRIRNGQHLTTVDLFVSGFKPPEQRDAYLEQKATQRREEETEIRKRMKRREG